MPGPAGCFGRQCPHVNACSLPLKTSLPYRERSGNCRDPSFVHLIGRNSSKQEPFVKCSRAALQSKSMPYKPHRTENSSLALKWSARANGRRDRSYTITCLSSHAILSQSLIFKLKPNRNFTVLALVPGNRMQQRASHGCTYERKHMKSFTLILQSGASARPLGPEPGCFIIYGVLLRYSAEEAQRFAAPARVLLV